MNRRLSRPLAAAAFAVAALAPVAASAGNVSWGVSFGVPGFAAFAGPPAVGWGPVVRPVAPVFVAPRVVVAPAPVLVPAPVFVPAAVIVRPVRWHRPRPFVVYRRW